MAKVIRTRRPDGLVRLSVVVEGAIAWSYLYKTPTLDDEDPCGTSGDGKPRTHKLVSSAVLDGVSHIWTVGASRLGGTPAVGTLEFVWQQEVGGRWEEIGRETVPLSLKDKSEVVILGDVRFPTRS